MKGISVAAKVYQLEHGHNLTGVLVHGNEQQSFRYGLVSNTRLKTTYVHGLEGGASAVVIETVHPIAPEVGDKIQLCDGKNGRVAEISVALLDDVQLRFVTYEKADKIRQITVRFI